MALTLKNPDGSIYTGSPKKSDSASKTMASAQKVLDSTQDKNASNKFYADDLAKDRYYAQQVVDTGSRKTQADQRVQQLEETKQAQQIQSRVNKMGGNKKTLANQLLNNKDVGKLINGDNGSRFTKIAQELTGSKETGEALVKTLEKVRKALGSMPKDLNIDEELKKAKEAAVEADAEFNKAKSDFESKTGSGMATQGSKDKQRYKDLKAKQKAGEDISDDDMSFMASYSSDGLEKKTKLLTEMGGAAMQLSSSFMMVQSYGKMLFDPEVDGLSRLVALLGLAGTAMTTLSTIMPIVNTLKVLFTGATIAEAGALAAETAAQTASTAAKMADPIYAIGVAIAAIIMAIVGATMALAKANSAAAKAEERHAQAQEKLNNAQENAAKYEEEVSSLDQLMDKLADAKDNKKALADITEELNTALGAEYDLVNGGQAAYDSAMEKTRQLKEEKEKLLEAEKEIAAQSAEEMNSSITFESNSKGWFTTGEKYGGNKQVQGLLASYAKLSSKELEKFQEEGVMTLKINGNDEKIDYATIQDIISQIKENNAIAYEAYNKDYSMIGSFIDTMTIEGGQFKEGGRTNAEKDEIAKAFSRGGEIYDLKSALANATDEAEKDDLAFELETKLEDIAYKYPELKELMNKEIGNISADLDTVAKNFKPSNQAKADTVENLSKISNVLEDINEEGVITYETLAELEGLIGEDAFSVYANSLTKAKKGTTEYNNALTGLTHDIVLQTLSSRDLVNMGEEEIAMLYHQAGVTNYLEMARYSHMRAMASEVAAGRMSIESLFAQGETAGLTKEEILSLMIVEFQYKSATMDASAKIAYYNAIANAAHAAGLEVEYLRAVESGQMVSGVSKTKVKNADYRNSKNSAKQNASIDKLNKNANLYYSDATGKYYKTLEKANAAQAQANINKFAKEQDLGTTSFSAPTPTIPSGSGGGGGSGGSGSKDKGKDVAQQEKEAKEEHEKAIKEWEKTDAIERYTDELTRLEDVLKDVQTTLSEIDFEDSLFGEEKTASQAFRITYEKGVAAQSVAEEALRQFNELKDKMPEHAESIAEWRDKLQSLQETWQENVMTMRENSVSAAIIAGMEKSKERLEEEKEYVSKQQEIFNSIQELTTKSSYFAANSRKALIASSLANADKIGSKRKSEAIQEKERENEELIKLNKELNETISEANKEAMEADIAERAKERQEEWDQIQKDFEEKMQDIKDGLNEAGDAASGAGGKFVGAFNAATDAAKTLKKEIKEVNEEMSKSGPLYPEKQPTSSPSNIVTVKSDQTVQMKDGFSYTAKNIPTLGPVPRGYENNPEKLKVKVNTKTGKAEWIVDEYAGGYAKGTKNAKGGLSLVGEEGAELVIEPGGKAYLVGVNGPEFVNLKAGSEVMPAKDTKAVLKRSKTKPTDGSKKVDSFAEGTTGDNTISSGSSKAISSIPKSNKSFYDKEAKIYSDSLKDMSKEKEEYNKKLIDETQETYDTLYQQKVTQDQMVKDSNNLTLDEMKSYQEVYNTDIYNGIATNAENIKNVSEKKAGEIQTAVVTSNIVMKNDTATSAAIMEGTINKMSFTLPGINGTLFVDSVTSVLNSARAATGLTPIQQAEVRSAVQGGGGGDEAYSGKINATGNAKRVYELLKQKGVPDMSAKAIVANLQGESTSSINPASVGDGGTSFGIAQWHNTRGTNMKNYVGADWRTDLAGQVDFLLYEMRNSYPGVYKTLMNPGNKGPYDLIKKLVYEYEIPDNKPGATKLRYDNYLKLVKGFGSSGDGEVPYSALMPYIDTFNTNPLSMFEIMMYANMVKNAINNGNTERLFELMGPMFEWTDPLDPGFHVGSGVGWRIHPIHGDRRFHYGVDIGAPQGTPIYAVRPGVVEFAGYGGGAGNFVKIRHDSGYTTRYLHMVDLPSVSSGQMVRKGQVIGYVGSTGWSTGPHLHFEMYENGQVIDPLPKLPNYVTGTGKGKTKVTEDAIVGEIGPELAIFPDGSVKMLGQDGVEYAHIPAGTKIFNTAQTMEFLKTPKNYATGTLENKDAKYLTELNEAAKKFGIPPELFIAMADAESNIGTHANTWKSSGNKKAVGITQLSEKIFDKYKDELKSNEELKKALEENKISIDKARELNEENYKDNIWVTAAILKLIKDNKYKDDKDWKNVIGYYNSAGEEKWSEVAETAKHIEALFKAYATDTYKTENVQKAIEEAAKKIAEATDKNTEETKKTTDAVKEMNIKRAGVKDVTYQTTTRISDKGNPPIFNRLNAFGGIGGLSTSESGDVLASSDNYARILDYFNSSKEVQDMSYEYVRTRAFYSALNQVPNEDKTYKAWAINAVEDFKKLDLDEGTQQLLDLLKGYLEAETLNVEEYRKVLEPFLGSLSYRTKTLEGYGIDAGMLYSSIVNQKEETWDEEGFNNKDIGVRNADQRILADIVGSVNTQVATIAKEKDISIKYINDLLVANGLMTSDKHSGDIWSTETAAGAAKLLEDPSFLEKGIVTLPFLKDLRQMYISNQSGAIVGSLGEIVNMSRDKMKDYINNEELVDEIINRRIAVAGGYQLRDDELGKRIAKQINDEFFKVMDITLGEDGKTVVDWDFKKPELDNAQYIRDLNEIQAKDANDGFEDNNEFIKQFSQININAAKEFRNQADAMYDEQQRQDKLWDIRYKHGEVSAEEYSAYKEYAAEVYETVADIIEQEEEMYRTAYESNKELYEQYIDELTQRYELAANKAETLGSLYEQHFATMNNLADVQHEIDNTLRDSMMNTQWMDKKTRELLFDENDHYKITQKIFDIRKDMMLLTQEYQTKINSLAEDEWYKQERLTAEYQRQVQEKERSLAILRAEVGLEAKRNALTQALQEKNVRVFTGGRWQNVANFNDVRTKTQEYENQLYEIEKAEREQFQAETKDEFAREAEIQREAISAMNQAMTNLDEEFNALFGALGDLSDESIPKLIEGLESQESTLLSVMSSIGEKMGLEEDPSIETAKRKQEMNDLYEVNKESIFALYEESLKLMLDMELAEKGSEEYNAAEEGLNEKKAEIKKLGGEEFYYMLNEFGFGKNIQKIKSHQGSGDEYDVILDRIWANAGSRATSQLLSAKYDYVEAAEMDDEKLKLDATRKGKRARDVLGDLPYYESWKTWEGSIEEMEQKMAVYSEDLLTYALADFFLESGARDDENLKSILNTYAAAKKSWSDIDKKEKSGEISKEQAQKDKNEQAVLGAIQRADIGKLGYDKFAELLQVLSEEQLQTLINMVYGDVIPTLRDDTGLIDMPQGQFFEMSTLKNTLLNESESIKNLAMSLMSGLLPEEIIKNLNESNSTHVENVYIELPNVIEANTFAERFKELLDEGFINQPK